MHVLSSLFPNFLEVLKITYLFTIKGGWVLYVIAMIPILWRMYYLEIEHQYVHSQEWVFLSFRVPKENMVSTMAVETIFSQMHALHVGKTFPEKYIEGQIQLWYSLEIISMGGKISFIMRIPERMRDTVESAFYAHYPQAEISEVDDYMKNFEYDPEKPGDYDIFGTEWLLVENDVIPIRTYKDFEHPAAFNKIVDPLANFFEGMAKIKPYEFVGFQIIIQPIADEEWHPRGQLKIKELIGEEEPHKLSFLSFFLKPFEAFAKFSYKESLLGHHTNHEEEEPKRSNWLGMTEGQKERVTLIEKKIAKQGYKTKIRVLYIAPKDKMDMSKKGLLSGFYRPLGSMMTNKLKPDVRRTWTTWDYKISKSMEQSITDKIVKNRKRRIFKGYKNRDILIGMPMFILNNEEIATLYHFPITTETTFAPSAVEKTESKKAQAPPDLPVLEN
jgi:hypothetical protein